MNMWIQVAIDM